MTNVQKPSVETRIDALEMRIAYQDETIETLNKTITEQWQKLDTLDREIANLRNRVTESENQSGYATASESPPPHY